MSEETGQPTEKKSNFQNLLDSVVKTAQDVIKNAIQPGTRYVQATQKKIELFLLTRKITVAQNEFGKLVDKARESGLAGTFENPEVKTALENLDQLKQTASKLAQEIDALEKPIPPAEDAPKE